MSMYVQVALLSPPYSSLEYLTPAWFPQNLVRHGLRVLVPLGRTGQTRCGIILRSSPNSTLPDPSKVKELLWPLERQPLIDADLLALSSFLAKRQALEPGTVFGHCLPAGLRSAQVKFEAVDAGSSSPLSLSAILNLPASEKSRILRDFLNGKLRIRSPFGDSNSLEIWSVCVDPPWKLRPGAKRQIAVLDLLWEKGPHTRKQLLKALGSGCGSILESLHSKGFISKSRQAVEKVPKMPEALPALNIEQERAFAELAGDLARGGATCRLLHGITGSGKTAVYLALARHCLEQGKSVFLLAPEVALAVKLFDAARRALADRQCHLFHGYQTAVERERKFQELAANREPALVVGTRSALFLPLASPGLIILDEEHDASFKQDEGFPYHARECAWQRCKHNGALLLLGSATPDLRTFNAALAGAIGMSKLEKRASGGSMPPVQLIKMSGVADTIGGAAANSGILTRECEKALEDCLKRGEQAIVLLNRRGYAPLMYCPSCNRTMRCPHCEIGLTYHKNMNRVVCHYCGYSLPYPSPCPECGKLNLLPLGEGTEKLEEKLETIACQPVLRLDRDKARRQGGMEEIMENFASGASPILVGTQMISKGHHFPNVTLVVVADGDMGLNMPDYRAAERSFQLLVQTAGRAGRGSKAGQVLVQTRNPDHYCWEYVCSYDYRGFFEKELERRKRRLYPPFTNLALMRFSTGMPAMEAGQALGRIGERLQRLASKLDLRLLGPAPAPIAMIRGLRRYHFLIKGKSWENMRQLYFQALKIKESGQFRIFLDMDPVNMM